MPPGVDGPEQGGGAPEGEEGQVQSGERVVGLLHRWRSEEEAIRWERGFHFPEKELFLF